MCFEQTEEKCGKLQASLAEAEDKLSSKYPVTNDSTSQSTTAAAGGSAQVQTTASLSSSSSSLLLLLVMVIEFCVSSCAVLQQNVLWCGSKCAVLL